MWKRIENGEKKTKSLIFLISSYCIMSSNQKSAKRGQKAGKAMRKLKAQVKANTKMLKQTVEAKQIYITNSNVLEDDDTFEQEMLDGLAQGVADTGTGSTVSAGARIGNSINVKSLTARIILDGRRYLANPQNPAAKSGGTHRLIIYDSPCGESLTAADILRDSASTTGQLRSHYKVDVAQGKMYNIWYDKTFFLSDAKPEVLVQFSKRWKNGKQVIYDNNSTQPSNFRPKFLVVSHNVPPGLNNMCDYGIKLRYEDL